MAHSGHEEGGKGQFRSEGQLHGGRGYSHVNSITGVSGLWGKQMSFEVNRGIGVTPKKRIQAHNDSTGLEHDSLLWESEEGGSVGKKMDNSKPYR